MHSNSHVNYLALNQNFLNKALIFGAGPQEGTSENPIVTAEGLKVYLNGTHVMPEHEDLENGFPIGKMIHPQAMHGMPGSPGEISYELWTTEKEYIILIRLKLDESTNGESEPAVDILTLVQRNELPENIPDNQDSYYIISREMLLCHFDSLLQFYDNIEELDDWDFEDDALYAIVKYHFELKDNLNSKR